MNHQHKCSLTYLPRKPLILSYTQARMVVCSIFTEICVTAKNFVNTKYKALLFFTRGFFDNDIPHQELSLFCWDVIEEWVHYASHSTKHEPYSLRERAFWHLLHQLHFWGENKLLNDEFLRSEISTCIACLEDKIHEPLDFVGIRP